MPGARAASQLLAAVSGFFMFLRLNRYRIVAVTPQRVLILDAGRASMTDSLRVAAELPGRPGSARHRACGT